ncbi:Predicted acyl esterase [Lentzea albidocapillata subsp. violacea]|uniref:Predicted acyl esterase n=1 Tax=Lentzea albidocapillata subsp. violacea TaxID=128104 RepID=A0A1G9FY43_9PSEU|nr:CocE/NonD family hydrolase [Lentzea albidocapillata]SDK93289.1 Predicted acyl esterase [Lentzea albidocapillata subsp. violacea]
MRRSLVLVLVLLSTLLGTPAAIAAPGHQISYESITGVGGTALKALVVEPTGQGSGPFPLLVMPSSWAVPNIEYVGAAAKLAKESGYVVVSYTSRGFWDSGGQIDVAGPDTVGDVSKVIDWAIANAHADGTKVGAAGISYGAGQSLLAAAVDKRIKAVSALSTWTDLARSLYPNNTVNKQAVELLLAAGKATGRPGPVLVEAEDAYRDGRFADVLPISEGRSAASKIAQINANGTAVMIGNAWNDGLFAPGQVADFYGRLTGPKRLMLSPGDHATAELFGAAGLPNEIWESTGRWFDRYVKGTANGIDAEQPVQLKPNNGGTWKKFGAWPNGNADTVQLAGKRIHAGWGTVADSGTLLLSGALQGFLNIPTGVSLPFVDRNVAGVWGGPQYPGGATLAGTPKLRLQVTPSAETTTLFAYLYEVGPLGLGALITHKPIKVTGAGRTQTLDVELEPTVWNVGSGNRLGLVIDTVDPRYQTESTRGSTVTFGPSSLTVPKA